MTVYWPKIEAGKGNRVAGTRWAICFCCLLGWGLWFSSLVVPSTKAPINAHSAVAISGSPGMTRGSHTLCTHWSQRDVDTNPS